MEEWGFLELFAKKGVFYIISDGTLPSQKARPLHILPQALAYTFDSNSFFFWHIVQAGALTAKAACAGIIGLYLVGNPALAAFFGLLTLLYPADTMQMNFRSLSDNWAVALTLLSTVLLLKAFRIQSRWPRITLGATASAILAAGLLMWEAVAGLAALPFFLLFTVQGGTSVKIIRKCYDVVAIWTIVIVIWFAFFALAVRGGSQYQSTILSEVSIETLPKLLAALIFSGFYRAFYDSWIDVIDISLTKLSNFTYPAIFTVVVSILLMQISKCTPNNGRFDLIFTLRTVVAGIIVFILGYAPFLASYSHTLITQRTFLTTAIGGALVALGVVVYLFSRFNRQIVLLICSVFLGGCMIAQLYQFDRYNYIYSAIYRPLLTTIVPLALISPNGFYSVLYNHYGYLSDVWDLGLELKPALEYLLKGVQSAPILVCEGRTNRVLPRWHGEPARKYCKTIDGYLFIEDEGQDTFKGAAIGRLSPDGVISIGKSRLIDTALPRRVIELFALTKWRPDDSIFRKGEHIGRFECRFEYMWGYAVPCRTFGFFEAQPVLTARGSAYAWIGETKAGFIFDIEPKQGNYLLVVEIERLISPSNAVEIYLNGIQIQGKWNGHKIIEALFSGKMLRQVNNILEFKTELDRNLGWSIAVKRVSIVPQCELESGRPTGCPN